MYWIEQENLIPGYFKKLITIFSREQKLFNFQNFPLQSGTERLLQRRDY